MYEVRSYMHPPTSAKKPKKNSSWDAHICKIVGKGKAHVGKMDAILTDPLLDTRIKICCLL